MKKYLGSRVTAFVAIIVPVFVIAPIILSVIVLCAKTSTETFLIATGGMFCSVIWGIYLGRIANQLYSWGQFETLCVCTRALFTKTNIIYYEKCKSCGIGFYIHGILNSKAGTKCYFIFLSYDRFDENFRERINLWKPSDQRIKVAFNKKLYEYLIEMLPPKQAQMLLRDYNKYCSTGDGLREPF